MKFHKVFICSSDVFQATLLALCAFGKIGWHWFWIFLAIETVNSIGFEMRADKKVKEPSHEN